MDRGRAKAHARNPEESGEVGVASEAIQSDVRMLSRSNRRAQLQDVLDRASEVEPAELEGHFQRASQTARSALELAADDRERAELLQLWAELDIAAADRRAQGTERLKEQQEAVRKLEQAIQLDPERRSAWQAIADVLVKQRDASGWQDLASRLGERLGAQPSPDHVALARGTVLLELGRLSGSAAVYEAAAEAFDRAVAHEPDNGSAWLHAAHAASQAASAARPPAARTLLFAQLERLERGLATSLHAELIAELRRQRVRARLALCALVEGEARLEQLAAAGADLARVGVEDPRDVRVYEDWAAALVSRLAPLEGASARALLVDAAGELSRGIELGAPDEAAARLSNSRGLLLRALGDRPGAGEAFRRAAERWPAFEAAWSNWAALLLHEAEQSPPEGGVSLRLRALEVLWRGIQSLPDRAAVARLALIRGRTLRWLAEHGSAAERDPRLEEARREFERAAERDPASFEGFCEASDVLVEQARVAPGPRGRELIEGALEILASGLRGGGGAQDDRAASHLHHHRGLALLALGPAHRAEALRELERAAQMWEKNPQPWLQLAVCWVEEAQSAEPERARELYARAHDRLSRGLVHASEPAARQHFLEARARVSLRAAELEPSAARDRKRQDAESDFKRACDEDASSLAAWRGWSAIWRDRALATAAPEAALELWKQADGVLDAAMQRLPLGAATAALLTDRGDNFLAQAKRATGSDRRHAFGKALACFEEATQLAPADGAAWQSWGRALAARGRYDAAADPRASFRLAAERYRSAAAALPLSQRGGVWIELARAVAGFARRDLAQADPLVDDLVLQLEEAIASDPENRAAYYLARGNLQREAGRYTAAEADFACGRAAEPAREALYCQHNLSALLEQRGRAGREWRKTQRAYERFGRADAAVVGHSGVLAYEVFGDYDDAASKLSAAIDRRAANSAALQLTWTELARERAERDPQLAPAFAERVRDAERFIRTDRIEQPLRELQLGKLALWSRDYERAERHLTRARELDAWNADACLALGQLLLEQGKLELARTQLARAHELAPRDLRVSIERAKAADLAAAQALFREVLDQSPHSPDALLGLAGVHLRLGDAANERDEYVRAIECATEAISGASGQTARRLRASELAQSYFARGYAQLKLAVLDAGFLGVDRAALARADFRAALRADASFLPARDALAKLGPELGALHRHAGALISSLAVGLFVIAQLGFWFAADPVYQLCVAETCLPVRLRTLEFGGYCALTFGALTFIAIGLALPLRFRQQPARADVPPGPIQLTGTLSTPIN